MSRSEHFAVLCAMATLVALPFETESISIPVGRVLVTVPEALAGATILATLAAASSRPFRESARRVWPFAFASGLFIGALLVAALVAPEHVASSLKFVCRIAGGAAFGCAIAAHVAAHAGSMRRLLGAYATAVAVACVIAIVEYSWPETLAYLRLFREGPIYSAGLLRAASTYGYPNILATSVAIALPAVVSLDSDRAVLRAMRAATLTAMAIALVLTFSRGGLVAAAVALGLLASAAQRTGRKDLALRSAWTVALIGAVWLVAWLGANQLARRGAIDTSRGLLVATIEPGVQELAVTPGARASMPVRVTNAGGLAWESTDEAPFTLVSEWYDATGRRVTPEGDRTFLPPHIDPGGTVTVLATYLAPDAPGDYWLMWDVYQENRVRFHELGGKRSAVHVASAPDLSSAAATIRSWQRTPAAETTEQAPQHTVWVPPERRELWRAALAIFRDRPLTGIGPDNFRLAYGRYLGFETWDVRVYANNLYLEILATSGLLGFGAFAALVACVGAGALRCVRRHGARPDMASLALAAAACFAAILVHGLVDYFLEFTAGYIPFWMVAGGIAGLAAGDQSGPED